MRSCTCVVCGDQFAAISPQALYCSDSCRRRQRHCKGKLTPREQLKQERRRRLADLWEAGMSLEDIAVELVTTRGSVGALIAKMRRDGWQLDYRRTAYAEMPYESGTWEERKAGLAARQGRKSPPSGWTLVLRRDPCAYCGRRSNDVDHIVPVGRGGAWDSTNLTGSCKPCNSSKQVKSLLGFMMLRQINAERAAWMAVAMV
jgi:biotin operon repressor